MKTAGPACFLIFTAAFFLFAASCAEEEEDASLTYNQAVEKGKRQLALNQGDEAVSTFRYARDLDPERPEANIGLMLAQTMGLTNLADSLLDMFADVFDAVESEDESAAREVGPPSGEALQDLVDKMIGRPFSECEAAYGILSSGMDFDFDLPTYKLYISDKPVLSLGGEFDKTDVYWLGALTATLNAAADIAVAHNLDFDLYTLLRGLDLSGFDLEGDPMGALLWLADLLDGLLGDPYYQDFLTLLPDGGAGRMQSAGENLGRLFDRFYYAFSVLGNETDDQSDDQLAYMDANGNGRYDRESESIRLGDAFSQDAEQVAVLRGLSLALRDAFWEGSALDVHPDQVDKLTLADLNGLLIYLGVLDRPILPDWIGFDIGSFFADPSPAGIRDLLTQAVGIIRMIADYAP